MSPDEPSTCGDCRRLSVGVAQSLTPLALCLALFGLAFWLGGGTCALGLDTHTFVSLMSTDGVPIEEIARLAGHSHTATTELVYNHELRPVITTGAEVMDRILNLGGGR